MLRRFLRSRLAMLMAAMMLLGFVTGYAFALGLADRPDFVMSGDKPVEEAVSSEEQPAGRALAGLGQQLD